MQFYDCPDCTYAFKSVLYAATTLFKELLAGGSWMMSLSLLGKDPIASLLLMIAAVTVTLGI